MKPIMRTYLISVLIVLVVGLVVSGLILVLKGKGPELKNMAFLRSNLGVVLDKILLRDGGQTPPIDGGSQTPPPPSVTTPVPPTPPVVITPPPPPASVTPPPVVPGEKRTIVYPIGVDPQSKSTDLVTTIISTATSSVVFDIGNAGTIASGPWTFRANLPIATGNIFNSETQTSLLPGEKIRYSLSFAPVDPTKTPTVTITADPDNKIFEEKKANNSATSNLASS